MGIQSGDTMLLQFDNIDIASDEITVDIRDDAIRSDGEPVRGRDFINQLAIFWMFDNITPVNQTLENGERGPLQVSSITDFEYDDSSFTLISEGDFFDDLIGVDIWAYLLTKWVEWGGLNVPTHTEPYDGYTDIVWDWWDMYLSGEWQHPMNGGDTRIQTLLMEYFGMNPNDVPEQMRDPDNVVTNGARTPAVLASSRPSSGPAPFNPPRRQPHPPQPIAFLAQSLAPSLRCSSLARRRLAVARRRHARQRAPPQESGLL